MSKTSPGTPDLGGKTPSSNTLPGLDPASSVNRRDFLQQAAAGGAAFTAMTEYTMQPASGNQSQGNAADSATNTATAEPSIAIQLKVNGQDYQLNIDPRVTLLDLVRNHLSLTGAKKGCDHGQCGACTMLVDGRRIYSCLSLAAMNSGSEVTTIEGLAQGEQLHPLQAAFIERDAFQCGFCTSGQICSGVGLLKEGKAQSEAEVRELMSGNLCRCGCYLNIVKAIRDVQAMPDA